MTLNAAPADSTRNSLVDAIAAKVELAAETTDPTEKARLEGSIRRMTKDLDADDARRAAALAETVRLHKDGQEIALTFEREFGGMVQVAEDGTKPARWDFAWASRELVTRLRLGWTVASSAG